MPDNDWLTHIPTQPEVENPQRKTLPDYFALGGSTFGVGYIPLAPGTWGSAVGVLIYLFFRRFERHVDAVLVLRGSNEAQIAGWDHFFNVFLFTLFCAAGIRAASRAAILLGKKDPQKVVVDEILGQLTVFLFVPFAVSWKIVLAGFVLFRLFDIWKPYPIRSLENLSGGLGICADDLLAGVYGGVVLSFIYAASLAF